MSQEIIMPKLGLTMTHGKITKWLKKEGDRVSAGEPVAEIETDKISSEIESPADGYILKILAFEGDDRDIAAPVAIIGDKDEKVDVLAEAAVGKKEAAPKSLPESRTAGPEIKISPLARKMAEDNGIDWTSIKGTGPDGRIVKEDILAAIDGMKTMEVSSIPAVEERRVPLEGIRKIVAQRLSQSKHDIPHTYFKIAVDAGNAMELKNRVSEVVKARTGRKLTLNVIITKAVAAAIQEFPDFNASLVEDEIVYYKNINIGVAVNSERGLVVPVIRNANEKSLTELCSCMGELVDRARSGKLSFEDISGGTFTVSNLGAYHIDEFCAIINPPESAILAVGRAADTPCAHNGEIVVRPVMNLTLSVDHRIIDGAVAARFMEKLKSILENPYFMLI